MPHPELPPLPEPDGVPPFDPTQPCDMERILTGAIKPGAVVPTMCMRCHNPHHACDFAALPVRALIEKQRTE